MKYPLLAYFWHCETVTIVGFVVPSGLAKTIFSNEQFLGMEFSTVETSWDQVNVWYQQTRISRKRRWGWGLDWATSWIFKYLPSSRHIVVNILVDKSQKIWEVLKSMIVFFNKNVIVVFSIYSIVATNPTVAVGSSATCCPTSRTGKASPDWGPQTRPPTKTSRAPTTASRTSTTSHTTTTLQRRLPSCLPTCCRWTSAVPTGTIYQPVGSIGSGLWMTRPDNLPVKRVTSQIREHPDQKNK